MAKELVIACYTAGPYEVVANEYIIPSVEALGLAHEVREIESLGSWVKNGFACQLFIRRMCDEFPNTDFLFVDADARINSDPWPFLRELVCDVAAHMFRGKELLTGTLYLPSAGRRAELLDEWIVINEAHPGVWDQINAQHHVINKNNRFGFVVEDLPPEYCCIFDLQRKYTPNIVPVVEHFQASRRLRRGVDHAH